jgi:hypothetical protein
MGSFRRTQREARLNALLYRSGPAIGKFPCFGCIRGVKSQDDVGLPVPNNCVPSGDLWEYFVSWTNVTFTGNCKLSWTIAAAKKVLENFSYEAKDLSGGPYLYGFDRSRPSYSGPATLTAGVDCSGAGKQSTSAPLIFQ